MWTSLNKKMYLLVVIVIFIGLFFGTLFVFLLDESLKEIIFLNVNEIVQGFSYIHINNIINHFIILSSIFILSIFVIGSPFVIFYLFYNGFSIGFCLCSLFYIFGIKGIIYGLIYVFVVRGVFLFFLLIISITLIKIVRYVLDSVIKKTKNSAVLYELYRRVIVCIFIILVNDIVIYFIGSKIINIFNFLVI